MRGRLDERVGQSLARGGVDQDPALFVKLGQLCRVELIHKPRQFEVGQAAILGTQGRVPGLVVAGAHRDEIDLRELLRQFQEHLGAFAAVPAGHEAHGRLVGLPDLRGNHHGRRQKLGRRIQVIAFARLLLHDVRGGVDLVRVAHGPFDQVVIFVQLILDDLKDALRRQAALDAPILRVARVAAGDQVYLLRHRDPRQEGAERGFLRMVNVRVHLAVQMPRRQKARRLEAIHLDAIQHLEGFLLAAPRDDGAHLHAAPRQFPSDRARGAPKAAVFSPGKNFNRNKTDLHNPVR